MKHDDWIKTCRAFQRIAAKEGVSKIADEIPAGRDTVYRMLRGETELPSRAVRAGIERIVREHADQEPKA